MVYHSITMPNFKIKSMQVASISPTGHEKKHLCHAIVLQIATHSNDKTRKTCQKSFRLNNSHFTTEKTNLSDCWDQTFGVKKNGSQSNPSTDEVRTVNVISVCSVQTQVQNMCVAYLSKRPGGEGQMWKNYFSNNSKPVFFKHCILLPNKVIANTSSVALFCWCCLQSLHPTLPCKDFSGRLCFSFDGIQLFFSPA